MSQFLLPDLGEGLEEAQLVAWLVRVGDSVSLNQPICQVETAKAMVDIPSPFAGTVQQLHANPGDTVPVGAPLVTIAESGALAPVAPTSRRAESAASHTEGASGAVLVGYGTEGPAQTFTRRRRVSSGNANITAASAEAGEGGRRDRGVDGTTETTRKGTENTEHTELNGGHGEAIKQSPRPSLSLVVKSNAPSASPLVRKMAAERGIDLSTIAGSGPGGRIRVEDLEASLARSGTTERGTGNTETTKGNGEHGDESKASAFSSVTSVLKSSSPAEDEERISTVGLRKAIAARMVRAATTIPHFTEYSQFDASALVAVRERLKADPAYAGAKLTFLPFFVRALVRAVQAYPILNSRWDEEGNAIVVKKSIHAGIATDTPRGLLVPVVHNAHSLGLPQIAAECGRLVALAREGKLDAKSLSGSTITITNVGAAGPVDTGAPLINPPEACVVGFGAIKPRPTVVGDALAVRPGCWISISCDHRIVDGAAAAQFMGVLVDALEHPESLSE